MIPSTFFKGCKVYSVDSIETVTVVEERPAMPNRKARIHFENAPDGVTKNELRTYARCAFEKMGMEQREINSTVQNLTWSAKAGCKCGCSPGFIVNNGKFMGSNVFIKIQIES